MDLAYNTNLTKNRPLIYLAGLDKIFSEKTDATTINYDDHPIAIDNNIIVRRSWLYQPEKKKELHSEYAWLEVGDDITKHYYLLNRTLLD